MEEQTQILAKIWEAYCTVVWFLLDKFALLIFLNNGCSEHTILHGKTTYTTLFLLSVTPSFYDCFVSQTHQHCATPDGGRQIPEFYSIKERSHHHSIWRSA